MGTLLVVFSSYMSIAATPIYATDLGTEELWYRRVQGSNVCCG